MSQFLSRLKTNLKWYFLAFLVFLSILLWLAVLGQNKQRLLTVVFLNVEQGDAIFMESPTGIQLLIDAGPNRFVAREISKVMPWYDRTLDAVIVTHPDKDHFEGFISLLGKYKTKVFIESGVTADNQNYNFLKEKVLQKNIPIVVARRGQIIDIGGGAYIEILFPDRDVSGLGINDASIVAKLVYGETSVMLTGDSPKSIESYLVSVYGERLDSDILKAGHHGSKTSSGEDFVSVVSPDYTIISAEKDSRYGHPHQEVLDVLEKEKSQVLGTYDLGTITFISDGENFVWKK